MTKESKKENAGKRHHHLSPLEIQAISDARARGLPVRDLARQYQVSRQTIYNAIRASREMEVISSTEGAVNDGKVLPAKRLRSKRITSEMEEALASMKRKCPTWGVEYLREQWARTGNPPLSRSSVYRILRAAGLQSRQPVERETFNRFEMLRPGQLWQMDIEGKLYLSGIGWVHGFAILDDHSRFCPAFRYVTDATLSNGILVLHEAIEKHGVPEAMYVDNGSQFKSRGERMNNFELFCAAHDIHVVHSTPYRPQGKGKIERFFETVENQFIARVRAAIVDGEEYALSRLNHELEDYLRTHYHVRVHGTTKETPLDRFSKERLRAPDPPVDVVKFLERGFSRRVSKTGEVSFNGYKIQVPLPAYSRVVVVETIESIRIEHGTSLTREIQKRDLTKIPQVKRQDGLGRSTTQKPMDVLQPRPVVARDHQAQLDTTYGPDEDGFYHRVVNNQGKTRWIGNVYCIGLPHAGKHVLIKVVEKTLHVHVQGGPLLKVIPIRKKQ